MSDQDSQAEEQAELTSFFSNYNPRVEESSSSDIKSKREKIALFGGEMKDIDVFLKHEKFRLKYYEFRLKRKTQINENESKFKDSKNERRLRKENAKKAFWFSCGWAIFVGLFIVAHGLEDYLKFKVTSNEFMFVCGTLTASILIFYLTVIKNLFPNKPEISKNDDSTEQNSI